VVGNSVFQDDSVQNFGSVLWKLRKQFFVKLENFPAALLRRLIRMFINNRRFIEQIGEGSGVA
jgi:hypothetical protein